MTTSVTRRKPAASLTRLEDWLKDSKHLKAPDPQFAKNIVKERVIGFMQDYLNADRVQSRGEWLAGFIYSLYFQADQETQRGFVAQLCKLKQIDVPDESWTPRQRLIVCVYGDQPELIEDGDGKYDSKGGKRITAAVRIYEEQVGIREAKERKKRAEEVVPRKTKDLISTMRDELTAQEWQQFSDMLARCFGKKALRVLPAKTEEQAS